MQRYYPNLFLSLKLFINTIIENKKSDLPIDDVVIDRDIFVPCDGLYSQNAIEIIQVIQINQSSPFTLILRGICGNGVNKKRNNSINMHISFISILRLCVLCLKRKQPCVAKG